MSDPTQLDLIKSFLAAPAGGAKPRGGHRMRSQHHG